MLFACVPASFNAGRISCSKGGGRGETYRSRLKVKRERTFLVTWFHICTCNWIQALVSATERRKREEKKAVAYIINGTCSQERLCEQDRKGWKSTDRRCEVPLHLEQITPLEIHMENVQNCHHFVSDTVLLLILFCFDASKASSLANQNGVKKRSQM